MDKQKQIEEMAKVYCQNGFKCEENCQTNGCRVYEVCTELYDAGYRKIPENAVVLTGEEYKTLLDSGGWHEGYCIGRTEAEKGIPALKKYIRKETAEKFAEMAKARATAREVCEWQGKKYVVYHIVDESFDVICKGISEGKDG